MLTCLVLKNAHVRGIFREKSEDILNTTSSYFKYRKEQFYWCYSFSFTEIKR